MHHKPQREKPESWGMLMIQDYTKLSPNEELVLDTLIHHCDKFMSPTDIGLELLGKNDSTWASRYCKKLVKRNIAIRNSKGQYKWNAGRNTMLKPQKEKLTKSTNLKCPNGDIYIISKLSNGITISKKDGGDGIKIGERNGNQHQLNDNLIYIY